MASGVKSGANARGAGRPKGHRNVAPRAVKIVIEELARTHAPAALQALVDICCDPDCNPGARVAAAIAIIDRGYGKPRQAVEVSGEGGGPLVISPVNYADLAAIAHHTAIEDGTAHYPA